MLDLISKIYAVLLGFICGVSLFMSFLLCLEFGFPSKKNSVIVVYDPLLDGIGMASGLSAVYLFSYFLVWILK